MQECVEAAGTASPVAIVKVEAAAGEDEGADSVASGGDDFDSGDAHGDGDGIGSG